MNFLSKAFLPVLFLLSAVGCVDIRHNISNDPKYKTNYSINQLYEIQKPLFVEKEYSGFAFMQGSLCLEQPGFSSDIPKTADEYRLGDKEKWPKVLGLIEPKTEVKIVRLERQENEICMEFFVKAQILNGVFTNHIVDLALISNRANNWVPIVNPELLELKK